MRYLFRNWDDLARRITNSYLMLFLDYDGTLTPIAESPSGALIPKETKKVLKELSKNPKCKLAVITGRSLKDIRKRVGLRSIIYSGNHGLEIEGPKIRFEVQVPPDYRSILQQIYRELSERLSKCKGVLLENKGLVLALHYRLVGKRQVPFVRAAFHKVVTPYLWRTKIAIETGKKVLEVRPSMVWGKGRAVLWLFSRQKSLEPDKRILPIYVGDDATDEDAFKTLKNDGLTVFVGNPRKSDAQYCLKGTKEVFEFLKSLSDLLSANSLSL